VSDLKVCNVSDRPEIGTVANPVYFSDSDDLYLGYEVAPISGGGCAVLKFEGVIEFRDTPLNSKSRFASVLQPWLEILGFQRMRFR
jgi:hypothetical protein